MKNKVLIIGSSGMLGQDLIFTFHENGYEVFGVDIIEDVSKNLKRFYKIDLATDPAIFNIIEKIEPDLILYVAAIVNLNICEDNKLLADTIHHTLPAKLAKVKPKKTKFVYVSTDSVFDGKKGNYSESDRKNPLNHYALTKSLGEDELATISNCIVIRTNIFGFNDPLKCSLAEWAIKNLQSGEEITGFDDVIFNAIYTRDLAEIIEKIWNQNVPPLLNVATKGFWSKYEFLKMLSASLNFDPALVKRGNSKDINFSIKRPLNTSLSTIEIEKLVDLPTKIHSLNNFYRNYLKTQS